MTLIKEKMNSLRCNITSEKIYKIISIMIIVFATYPVSIQLISTNVDLSGMYFLNIMHYMGVKFGTDIMFTYGPLGFLYNTEPIGYNAVISLVFYTILALLFAWLLWHTFSKQKGVRGYCLIALFAMIILSGTYLCSKDYYISLIVFLAISLAWYEENNPHKYLILTTIVSILLALIKFNTGIQCMITLVLYVLGKIVIDGRKSLYYFIYPVAMLVGYMVCFFIHNPSINGIIEYVVTNLEISSGYNSAMSIVPDPKMLFGAVLCGGSYILFLLVVFFSHRKTALYLLLFSGALFQSFKHGFVRGDAHVYIFFMAFSMIIAVIALFLEYDLIICKFKAVPLKLYISIITIFIMFIVPMYVINASVRDIVDTIPEKYDQIKNQIPAVLSQKIAESEEDLLPQPILDEIGNDTVAVLPWELSIGAYNDINMVVMPALQSLMAYTPELDKKNASFFEGDDAPEYIVFALYTIDNRIPLLETPATWNAIYENYDAVMLEGIYLLLQKSDDPYQIKLGEPEVVQASSTAIVNLPQDNMNTFVRVETDLTLWGKLNKLFYQIPPVDLTLIYSDGSSSTGRVIPEVMENGVILDMLPHTLGSTGITMNGLLDEKSVIAFQFSGDGWKYYKDQMSVSFLPVLSEKQNNKQSIYARLEVKQTADPTTGLKPRTGDMFGSFWIDFINGALAGDVEIRTSNLAGLQISGWALDTLAKSAPKAVYLKLDDKYYNMTMTDRVDVSQAILGNSNDQLCGYEGWVSLKEYEPGVHSMGLVIIYDDNTFFDTNSIKTIVIEE